MSENLDRPSTSDQHSLFPIMSTPPSGENNKAPAFLGRLSSAACEWLLILFLFADALISHLILKFARRCRLPPPCPLCTRLDHILGNRKQEEHYRNLVCTKHRDEVSSMATTCPHAKKPANAGPAMATGPSRPPLHRGPGRPRFARREGLRRLRARRATRGPGRPDSLSDVGRSRVAISSDSESELLFSDVDEAYAGCGGNSKFALANNRNGFGSRRRKSGVLGFNEPKSVVFKDSEGEATPDTRKNNVVSIHEMPESTGVGLSILLSLKNVPASSDMATLSEKSIAHSTDKTESSTSNETTKITELPSLHKVLDPITSFDSNKTEQGTDPTPQPSIFTGQPDENELSEHQNPDFPISPLETNNLSYDSSATGDVDHETTIDRLKRQAKHDRRRLSSLYRELEEERNAASVAANEAMAMITRLQEEKAALRMEALQYLRTMEEQAEYDSEALARVNDLLAEKEREVQDLEYELKFYRENFGKGMCSLEKEGEKVDVSRRLEDLAGKIRLELNRLLGFGIEGNGDGSVRMKGEMGLSVLWKEVEAVKERVAEVVADRDFLELVGSVFLSGKDGEWLARDFARRLH